MITEDLNLNNIEQVAEIERECIETPWGYNGLLKDIDNKNAFYICVNVDGKIAGYGGIWLSVETADITNIAVLPLYRRQGIGTVIVEALKKKAYENDIYDINLEVNENNISAILLYEKCGFKKVGIRKKYYNNKDNAIIMKWEKADGTDTCD